MTSSSTTAVLNLRRLLLLRGIAITGWLAALYFILTSLELELLLVPIAVVISSWILVSLATWWWLRDMEEIPDPVFFSQLVIDILLLTALLYFTGGSTNPLTLLFLLPLTISAALLPGRYTWIIALLTVACYTVLLYVFIPLPFSAHAHEQEFNFHIIGMWSGFVLSAGLIATFVARMGHALRERDRMLACSRERNLRDERIVALGTLAAGAAHELGTPLGTIGLLAGEIEEEYAQTDPELVARARILKQQIRRCKQTLAMLSMSAGQSQAAAGRCRRLDDWLDALLCQWRELRPGVIVTAGIGGDGPAPEIIAEQTLSHALTSILNNAADASHEGVEVVARWDAEYLYFEVCDRGAGLAPATLSAAGRTIFSTKGPDEGLGLGLYLAYSVIERLHGRVRLFNREGGGACTRVELPLAGLRVVRPAPGAAPIHADDTVDAKITAGR
jgi:two-component system, sensor histidine kinase RegB